LPLHLRLTKASDVQPCWSGKQLFVWTCRTGTTTTARADAIEDGSAAASGAIGAIMTSDAVWESTADRAGTGTSEGVLFVLAGLPAVIPNLSVRFCRSTLKLHLCHC
jgi:hypothetical protein